MKSKYHTQRIWATIAVNQMNASNEDIGQAQGHSMKLFTTGCINKNPERVDIQKRRVLDLLN